MADGEWDGESEEQTPRRRKGSTRRTQRGAKSPIWSIKILVLYQIVHMIIEKVSICANKRKLVEASTE
jgi:hypothetical protein